MKRAVAYCRVSNKGQFGENVGENEFDFDSQRSTIKEYCEENNIEMVNWYIDEGVSGNETKRPALDKLLSGEVTNPPVKYIIVAKADRLACDVMLYYAFKAKLEDLGLTVVSVTEDWSVQDKLIGMILEKFLAVVAQIEKENISVRMSGGRTQKAKAGGYAGGRAPMGYKVENGRLVFNYDEIPVVKFIFEKKFSGETMLGTMNALNQQGYTTRRGKPFVISTVQSIWNNERTYRGEYHYGKDGEWVKGEHPALINPDNSFAV